LIEGLDDVRLEVGDLDRSVAFYRDGLHFHHEDRDPECPPCAHLRAGELRLVLVQSTPVARPPRQRARGVLLSLIVSGVDAYHDALVARGVVPSLPVDRDGARSFTVRDPDGYKWRFHQGRA
jgi:catechol 2,3-dioxygenase-like lactoylglutathione lyase family enzyme